MGGITHYPKKSAIVVLYPEQDQFLSSLFLVKRKDRGGGRAGEITHYPKDLNSNTPSQHFKMEALFLLKKMLPGDKMCKIDLKYVYFAISLSVKSRRYVRFQWKGLLYEFCCLCFGLSPAPLVFTKLLKVPISLSLSLSLEKAHCRNNNLPR